MMTIGGFRFDQEAADPDHDALLFWQEGAALPAIA
jgi:hypothetical protein